jgi:hypothetical protein
MRKAMVAHETLSLRPHAPRLAARLSSASKQAERWGNAACCWTFMESHFCWSKPLGNPNLCCGALTGMQVGARSDCVGLRRSRQRAGARDKAQASFMRPVCCMLRSNPLMPAKNRLPHALEHNRHGSTRASRYSIPNSSAERAEQSVAFLCSSARSLLLWFDRTGECGLRSCSAPTRGP